MDRSSDELIILTTHEKSRQKKSESSDSCLADTGTGSSEDTSKRHKRDSTSNPTHDVAPTKAMLSPSSTSTGAAQLKDAKYIVRFKMGSFERDYYMNDDDPLESIYENLFGSDEERRIFYEGMKLSRLLSAGESGFFPGINYIYLSDDDAHSLLPKASAVIKIDENTENDLVIALEPTDMLDSILKRIEDRGVDLTERLLVYNGIVLDKQTGLDSLIRDGGVIDVVDCSSIS